MTSEEIKDLKKDLLEEIKNLLKQADVLHKTEVEQEEEEQKFNFWDFFDFWIWPRMTENDCGWLGMTKNDQTEK